MAPAQPIGVKLIPTSSDGRSALPGEIVVETAQEELDTILNKWRMVHHAVHKAIQLWFRLELSTGATNTGISPSQLTSFTLQISK